MGYAVKNLKSKALQAIVLKHSEVWKSNGNSNPQSSSQKDMVVEHSTLFLSVRQMSLSFFFIQPTQGQKGVEPSW
jgi:hypothetical protein